MKQTLFIAMILWCFVACKKPKFDPIEPEHTLPPATQEGKNTFGCYVNGELFYPAASFPNSSITDAYNFNTGRMFIDVQQWNSNFRHSISLYIEYDVKQDSVFVLSGPINIVNNYAEYYNDKTLCSYETDSINSGWIQITKIDTAARFISGLFEFTLVNNSCDTIRVTHGRFDIKD